MVSQFNKDQCKLLKHAWQDFSTVINTLPLSDTTVLLIFHAGNLLDKLANNSLDITYVEMVTERVNLLVKTSSVLLDIDDMLKLINDALKNILNPESTNLQD
jgi:hypothetical protein